MPVLPAQPLSSQRPGAGASWRSLLDRGRDLLLPGFGFVIFWEVGSRSRWWDVDLFSSPSLVVRSSLQQLVLAGFWKEVWFSAQAFGYGLGLALAVGVIMGLLLATSVTLRMLLDPLLMFVYTLPREAFMPLLIIWLGFGKPSEIAVIFVGAFFPILLNTMAGVSTVDPVMVRAARAFMASRWQVLRTVLLPGALPAIMTGIRLGIGRAVMGVVVAEMYAGTAGIGGMIMRSQAGFNVDRMLFNALMVTVMGIVMVTAVRSVERRLSSWREEAF